MERQRIFGLTNLRTFADGGRVLRTLLVERFGGRRPKPPVLAPVEGLQRRPSATRISSN